MYKYSSFFMVLVILSVFASCKPKQDIITHEFDTINVVASAKRTYHGSATRINDLLHTSLHVGFDWQNQYLNGVAQMFFTPYFYDTDSLTLDAKGFDVNEVSLQKGEDRFPLTYKYDGEKIRIQLDKTYKRGEEYIIYIDYTAKPNELESGGSEAITSDKGLYFINPLGEEDKPMQIWTQGETEASSCWFPTIDKPNERTSQEIRITVDNRFKTLSNGNMISSTKNSDGTRTDYWVQEKPHAPYLFMMAVGEFDVTEETWNGMKVDYWVEKEYGPYAKEIFGNTPEMLTLYSNLLGVDYPWDKYSQVVVRDFVSGAMENTSAVIFFDAMHRNSNELLDETHEDIVAHELVHHWFGDLVTCESWANLPLNESFATYGEYWWIDHKYGKEEADHHWHNDFKNYMAEAEEEQKVMIRYYYDDKEDMFDGHSYQKGGCILHMLRHYLGDDAFFTGLNHYLTENAYNTVEIHQLRLSMEAISGEDLNWFFNQWFLDKGHPVLDINYETKADSVIVNIDQNHSAENGLVYRIPMAIDVYTASGVKRHDVWLEDESERFALPFNGTLKLVNVDADKTLLCEKSDNKSFDQFAYQYNNAAKYLDRYEAVMAAAEIQKDNQAAHDLLVKATSDKFWYIRKKAIDKIHLDNNSNASLLTKLEILAKNDEKSDVRAAAIKRLGKLRKKAYSQLTQELLNDPSPSVKAHALVAHFRIDSLGALAKTDELANIDNSDMLDAVSFVYSRIADSKSEGFFTQNLKDKDGYEKYLSAYHYGSYLARTDKGLTLKGLPLLEEVALDKSLNWVRYGGMAGINQIAKGYGKRIEGYQEEIEFLGKSNSARTDLLKSRIADAQAVLAKVTEIQVAIRENEMAE